MNEFVDILTGVIFAPADTFAKLTEKKYLTLAMVVLAIASIPMLILQQILVPAEEIKPLTAPYIVQVVLLSAVYLFVIAGLFHVSAKILGGDGEYLTIVQAISFSVLPRALMILLIPFAYILGDRVMATVNIANIGTMVWLFVLVVVAIKETYEFTTFRAVGTLLVAFGLIIVVGMFIVTIIGTFFPEWFPDLSQLEGVSSQP